MSSKTLNFFSVLQRFRDIHLLFTTMVFNFSYRKYSKDTLNRKTTFVNKRHLPTIVE